MAAAILAAILTFLCPVQAMDVSARSAIVLDGDSGAVLWEKNARDRALIASTTKIMTALLVLEHGNLDEVVEIPAEAVGIEGSSMYLRAGERLTVKDLLHGLMLSSGNDAAVALAIHVSGSQAAFVDRMNRKARELGLEEIHFANPHGLDSSENYATAESLGNLAAAAMRNPQFRELVSAKTYVSGNRSLRNHNKLLWQYPGAVGVKTGYTREAGRILVGSAERNGRRLISVTISAPSDWADHRQLLDYGFSQYENRTLVEQGQPVGGLPVISGVAEDVPLLASETVSFSVLPGETAEYRLLTVPFVYAPVESGQRLGTLQVYVSGILAGQTALQAGETVAEVPEQPGLLSRILSSFSEVNLHAGTCAKDTGA